MFAHRREPLAKNGARYFLFLKHCKSEKLIAFKVDGGSTTRAPKNLDFQGISDLEVWRSAPTEKFVKGFPCSQYPSSPGLRGHAACIQHFLEWLRSPVDRNSFGWAPLVTPVQILNEAVHARLNKSISTNS